MMRASFVPSAEDSPTGAAAESNVPTSSRQGVYDKTLVGVAAVAAVVASLVVVPDVRGVLGAALALLMLAIAIIDARRFIIPNPLTAAALVLGVLHAAIVAPFTVVEAIAFAALRGAVVALAFFGLAAIYERLRGREGLGLGDVKLAGVGGVWLDWLTIPIAVEIAALAAIAVYVLHNLVRRRPLRATARLPFGPFFASAIWLGWLFEAALM
jgi:leader peptidase (prepilin peptidase) / N-methyltransferase